MRARPKTTGAWIAAQVVLVCSFASPPAGAAIGELLAPDRAEMTPARWLPPVGEFIASDTGTVSDDALADEILSDEPFLPTDDAWSEPRLSVRLGAVLLQRARPQSELLLYELGTGTPLLDPYDLVFPFRGGVDAGLVWYGPQFDLEFRYFGVEQWTASDGPIVTDAGAQLNIPGVDPFPGPLAARLFGSTSLHSFEWNVRADASERWTWLAGFRYIAFRDMMGLTAGDAPLSGSGTAVFGTTNHLFGLQIGADGILWDNGRRFRVESAIKAGVYADGARLKLSGDEDPGDDSFDFVTLRDHTAFVGDMNFVGVYQLNERWALRAGYQLLWLSGVAVGSLQFHSLDLVTPRFSVNTSGTVFFHGVLLGAERTW